MKDKKILFAVLAAILATGLMISPAMAYFTTHLEATGAREVSLGSSTFIKEEVDEWTKHLVVTNDGPAACYVRAAAFAPTGLKLEYSGSGWTDGGDGYYYYGAILEGGDASAELKIEIQNIPEDVKDGDELNVAVVYESVPVLYDADGNALEADWSMKVIAEGSED